MIGLGLSGGGFRATLFHLGVIRYLYETKRLKDVKYIASVSGGSVLGAHLVLEWSNYNGNQEQFSKAAKRIIDFVQQDVRGYVIRRWIFWRSFLLLTLPTVLLLCILVYPPWLLWLCIGAAICFALGVALVFWSTKWSRIQLLQQAYDESLYKYATVNKLRAVIDNDAKQKPRLYLMCTNLTTGDLCAVTETGLLWWTRSSESPRSFPQQLLSVAMGVTASSAFPPAFPPVIITRKLLRADANQFQQAQYFTDGGVYDNLGIKGLRKAIAGERGLELIVSDAERRFDWVEDPWLGFRFVLPRAQRSSDIVMNRVTEYQSAEEEATDNPPRFVRLKEELQGLPDPIPQLVRNIRTDLDCFSRAEIQLLVYAGYVAAGKCFSSAPASLPEGMALTEGYLPFVKEDYTDRRWLPFTRSELGKTNAAKALGSSSKIRLLSLAKPHCCSPATSVLLVFTILLFAFIIRRNTVPNGLRFQEIFSAGTAEQEKIIEDSSLLLNFKHTLVHQVPRGTFFFGVTPPLGEFTWQRPSRQFVVRIRCKEPRHKIIVELLRRRIAGQQVVDTIITPA